MFVSPEAVRVPPMSTFHQKLRSWDMTNNVPQIADITHSAISKKNSSVIQIESILNAKTDIKWAHNILLAMIHNLSFDGSVYGHFWTPDKDIQHTVILSGSWKNLWVKLLGTKMRVLVLQLDTLDLSDTHKSRIIQLDQEFKIAFPPELRRPYESRS